MLVENATSPWGQYWERVFHKHSRKQYIVLVPLCKNPFPKIVTMTKLDIHPISAQNSQKGIRDVTTNLPTLVGIGLRYLKVQVQPSHYRSLPVDTFMGIKYTKANALLSNMFTVNLLPKYISYHLSSAFTDSQTVATYIIINRCL